MLQDILAKPRGRDVLQAVLDCHKNAAAEERVKMEDYKRKYPNEEWWKSIRHGFKWSEPAKLLLKRGIAENPHGILTQLKSRGLLEKAGDGAEQLYRITYPQIIADAIEGSSNKQGSVTAQNESAINELSHIEWMDKAYNGALTDVMSQRLEDAVSFGERFDARVLKAYLQDMFGPVLYFDTILALVHQYAMGDVEMLSPNNKVTNYTGFNLAFFGPPGTGKTFAIDDMIRGNRRLGVPPHGIPGRNRYCGGITPVQFIRMGEAYHDRKFNFVVPEFNDWFKDRGMVEPLKLAMEHREVKYETTRLTVGPYKFSSFFSVNYNVHTSESGYRVTVSDPNFNALEDRMLCRLHKWTKDRFRAIDKSAMNLELGKLHFDLARSIRKHLVLMHGVATKHPLVSDTFSYKPVMIDEDIYELFSKANDQILSRVTKVNFSTRLRSRAIKLACAISLMEYFRSEEKVLYLTPTAKEFALRFYLEEVGTRVGGKFDSRGIALSLGLDV